jgi:type I restriction enzyme M protein
MPEPVSFHRFGEELWSIANVLRGDIIKVTEYLEEFSYFLFLKLLDDRERQEEELKKLNGKPYIPLIPDKYRFHNWADNPERWAREQGFATIIDFLNEMSADLARIPDERDERGEIVRDRSLIRKVFQHHIMRLRYPKTITELTRRLASLELASAPYDVLGRAFEFVIRKLGEQGQYGQYFTPRHIVDLMVKMMDPEIGEKVYDPAAGTGGFLVWSYEHVVRKIEERFADAVEQELKIRELRHNLYGVEKAPDVFKLGIMNLILHGDGSANFEEGDSLSAPAQDAHRNRYDVILTNPPFGPLPYDPSGVFEYPARLFEAVFLQHMMNALKPGGRCATVMKEGLLFSNSPHSLVNIRRRLVDEFNVIAVISLPSGVFLPYTGSKTSILVFQKPKDAAAPRTKEVWFYRIEDDGFELGATRRPLSEAAARGELAGDLPDCLAKFRKREESERSWLVPVETIRANDYNLTAGRYSPYKTEETEYEDPSVLVSQLIELEEEIAQGLKELSALIGEGAL